MELYVQSGLVQGDRQEVDSALVQANVHIGSMQRNQILEDARGYCRQVSQEIKDEQQQALQVTPSAESALELVVLPPKPSNYRPVRSGFTKTIHYTNRRK